jgi:hypothetical protein
MSDAGSPGRAEREGAKSEQPMTSPTRPRGLARRSPGCLANLVLLVVTVAIALGLGEGLTRLLRPQQTRHSEPLYRPAESLGYEHLPDLRVRVSTGERRVEVRTDREGYRVGARGRIEADSRLLLVGDSFVEAIEVPYEESVAGILQDSLPGAVGRPVAVRNAGASGYEPGQYFAAVRKAFARERFEAVVVAVYTGNDIVATREDYYAPRNRSPPLRPRWPRRWSLVAFNRSFLMPLMLIAQRHSQLAVLAWNSTELLRVRLGMWEWGFPDVMRRERANGPEWEVTAGICSDLAAFARERGVAVLFLVIPQYIQMDPDAMAGYARALDIDLTTVDIDQPSRRLARALTERGLEVIDLLDPLRSAHRRGPSMFGRVDRHFSPAGHLVTARQIEPWLRRTLGEGPVRRPAGGGKDDPS